jgi:transposase-like protein
MKGLCIYYAQRQTNRSRAQIRNRLKIRNDGMTVSAASAHYGVNSKSIYYWLRDGVVDGNRNLILENNKLKKELEIAYRIIGRFTAESQRPKG